MERMRSSGMWLCVALLAACGDGSSDANNGLYINAALGATLVQSPIGGTSAESSFKATVFVTRGNAQGQQVAATLTVNGVEVPQQTIGGAFVGYDFSQVTIPVTAGGTLTLHASFEAYSADLTLHCPEEVTITAPADNSQASVGDSVTVSWSGAIDHATSLGPDIMVRGFDPANGNRKTLDFEDRNVAGKTSDTFALPDPQGQPQWLIDLYVPGELVNNEAGAGFCMLDRRVHIASH